MLADSKFFWFLKLETDLERALKICIVCVSSTDNLFIRILKLQKSGRKEYPKTRVKLQILFFGKLLALAVSREPSMSTLIDSFNRWPYETICIYIATIELF